MESSCSVSEAGEDAQDSKEEMDNYREEDDYVENPYCIQDSYPQLLESEKSEISFWKDNEGKQ